MTDYLEKSGLKVDAGAGRFPSENSEGLPGTGDAVERFWRGLARIVADFMPQNRRLLAFRDDLQGKIDSWQRENGPIGNNPAGYERFLQGYRLSG